mmetsp:Transcript_7787/g.11609  ORF Transcript_7787/g.11609 Transcript_7787/m.11609 type:complete len:147 (-) Transcript_7787:960-1400(-)
MFSLKYPSVAVSLLLMIITEQLFFSTLALPTFTCSKSYRVGYNLILNTNSLEKCIDNQRNRIYDQKNTRGRVAVTGGIIGTGVRTNGYLTRTDLLKWPEYGSVGSSQKYIDFFIREADFAGKGYTGRSILRDPSKNTSRERKGEIK